jgi:hypothetical protein
MNSTHSNDHHRIAMFPAITKMTIMMTGDSEAYSEGAAVVQILQQQHK